MESIAFPDTDGGATGPITSAKLHVDFVNFASKAKKYDAKPDSLPAGPAGVDQRTPSEGPERNRAGLSAVLGPVQSLGGTVSGLDEEENLDWMWESYQQFRRAFRLAKNAGIVVFY